MLLKFIALAALIAAVWYGFRWVGRVQQVKEKTASKVEREKATKPVREPGAEDMVQCPKCRAYVPSGSARHCGRDGCPYPQPTD